MIGKSGSRQWRSFRPGCSGPQISLRSRPGAMGRFGGRGALPRRQWVHHAQRAAGATGDIRHRGTRPDPQRFLRAGDRHLIGASGGEVVAFGGDAITAVWAGANGVRRRRRRAQQALARTSAGAGSRSTTSIGDFGFAVRIGDRRPASVDVTVGGGPDRLLVLTQGDAIDRSRGVPKREAEPGRGRDPRWVDDRPSTSTKYRRASTSIELELPGTTRLRALRPSGDRGADPARRHHLDRRPSAGDDALRPGAVRAAGDARSHRGGGAYRRGCDPVADRRRGARPWAGRSIQITGGDKGTVALPDLRCSDVESRRRLPRGGGSVASHTVAARFIDRCRYRHGVRGAARRAISKRVHGDRRCREPGGSADAARRARTPCSSMRPPPRRPARCSTSMTGARCG